MVEGFTVLVQNLPLDDQQYAIEVVEYALRMIHVFGYTGICTEESLLRRFELSIEELSL